MGTQLHPRKGAQLPTFQSMSVVAKWLDDPGYHFVRRYRLWPRRHCVRWGPSSPSERGTAASAFGPRQLWPNSWMDQNTTWYEDIGLGPGDIVLDGHPAPPTERRTAPLTFRPMSVVAKWLDGPEIQDTTLYRGRPRPKPHCVRWGPSSPPRKGYSIPPYFSAHVNCGQTAG